MLADLGSCFLRRSGYPSFDVLLDSASTSLFSFSSDNIANMANRSRRTRNGVDNAEEEDNNPAQNMRERSRAVAEREAIRLARPDQHLAARTLGHASKAKSAVSSTPFGQLLSPSVKNDIHEEWCGPFSVARQMIAARGLVFHCVH